jgi:hypothetical protein
MFISTFLCVHVPFHMFIFMQHGRAACGMDVNRLHGRGHVAWTWIGYAAPAWIRSMYMGMQQGHGYAAWTWTCSWVVDMQNGHEY